MSTYKKPHHSHTPRTNQNFDYRSKYDHSITDHKAFYSAYANQAMHNAFITLSYINTACLGLKDFIDEAQMLEYPIFKVMETGKNDEKVIPVSTIERLDRMVSKHFPFLLWMVFTGKDETKAVDQNNLQYKGKALKEVIKAIINIRNYTCHYIGGDRPNDVALIKGLNNIFDANRDIVKDRFNFTPNDMRNFARYDRPSQGPNLLPEKVKKYEGINVREDRSDFKYSFYDKHNKYLSDQGIRFLICRFLETKDVQLFLKQVPGFKDSRKPEDQATLHMFGISSIFLPHEAVVSDDTQMGLMLDSINELTKVPGRVFNVISDKDKKKFYPTLLESEGETPTIDDETDVVMKRYNDRFAYFAMKYFDLTNFFPDVRFVMKYGKFYYRADKKTIVLEDKVRWLTKDMIGGHRWQDIKPWKENESISALLRKTHDLTEDHDIPYIQDREPEYITDHNRIMISLRPSTFPELVKDPDGINYKEQRSFDVKNTVYISGNDFHAFVYYCLTTNNGDKVQGEIIEWTKLYVRLATDLKNKTCKPLSKPIISNHRSPLVSESSNDANEAVIMERKSAVNQILETNYKGLTVDNIPTKWANYLMCISDVPAAERYAVTIKHMILEAEELLDKYERQIKHRKDAKEKNVKLIDTGDIAVHLADDMVKMLVLDDDEMPNSSAYLELQKTMAYWGLHQDRIESLFTTLKIDKGIPFFDKQWLASEIGIYQFFRKYFAAKIIYLRSINDFGNVHFLKNKRGPINLDTLIPPPGAEFPLALPRDYFTQKCKALLSVNNVDKELKFSELVNEKYKQLQSFYSYARNYEIFDNWLDDRRPNNKVPLRLHYLDQTDRVQVTKELNEWLKKNSDQNSGVMNGQKSMDRTKIKKLLKINYDNEEQIRWTMLKDKIWLQAIKVMLAKETKLVGIENLTLTDFSPESKQSVLNSPIEYKLDYSRPKDNIHASIMDPNMKIKDYGKFRKLLKDRRLPGLLSLWNKPVVMREGIRLELDNYQKYRLQVSAKVIEFERKIYDMDKTHFESVRDADHGKVVSHYEYLQYLLDKGIIDNATKDIMLTIRNGFQHNQYPMKAKVTIIDFTVNPSVSKVLSDYLIDIYDRNFG